MNNVKYQMYLLAAKLFRKGNDYIVEKMKKEGIAIGKNTHIFSNIALSEPYLVSIGDNCTISTNVSFITHDASVGVYLGRETCSDLCGKITIGDNCFIGANSTLMYGVSIANNTIIAAGSVVVKSIKEEGYIYGGNPAKEIGKIESFIKKHSNEFLSLYGKSDEDRKAIILGSDTFVER